MKKNLFFILCLFINLANTCLAQISFSNWDSIPVTNNTDTLIYAFAGGLNTPQFSDVDMDGDGIKDLFIFDRNTERTFTFINKGIPNQVGYDYNPSFRANFPKLEKWALLEDYNCDGKEDLFTYENNSFKVYRNDFTIPTGLQFTLTYTFSSSFIFVGPIDIPAFTDIDSDGDLDMLTFDPTGSFMYYFKNQSFENFGVCDSLDFILDDQCWGNFEEDFGSCAVALNISCKAKNINKGAQHAGSTLLAVDLNGDTLKDLIIGDLTCNNTYMLTNGGTLAAANIVNYDSLYPIFDPIDINRFPAPFLLDVNNDGLEDLIAAPNAPNVSENNSGVFYYENIGTPSVPFFDVRTNKFLINEMIEVGEGASPVFFDYNGDSLLDIVIGNFGYFSATLPQYPSGLTLYENIGTAQNPKFNLVSKDYLGIESFLFNGVYPAFGDIDGDGDEDLILGDFTGQLHLFTNSAGAGNTAVFSLSQPFYKSIDVGQFATPQLVDVNRDGKLDLLIGEREGTINYYENIGTTALANFNATPTNALFGGVDVLLSCCTGFSTPFLTRLSNTGEYTLLVGTEKGDVYRYTNIENNLTGNFTLLDTIFQNINEGQRNSISGGDLNKDGRPDLIIGNYGGGITLLKNTGNIVPDYQTPEPIRPFSISVFPNPVDEVLAIQINGLDIVDFAEIKIYNYLGQVVFSLSQKAVFNDWTIPVSTREFASGAYVISIQTESSSEELSSFTKQKFVIQH